MPSTAHSQACRLVSGYRYPGGWIAATAGDQSRDYCRALEQGEILFFPGVPFALPEADREFLISQRQTESRFHKNVSYRPQQDALRGTAAESAEDMARLRRIMRNYSASVTAFVRAFLAPYANNVALDFASFRPQEEEGRDLPLHKRNDLLHVDAFPTRPTRGARILRVFTNINPSQSRVWVTGESFHRIAPAYFEQAGLQRFAFSAGSPWRKIRAAVRGGIKKLGVPLPQHAPYDRFMLRFHDWLKENSSFQQKSSHVRSEFPPGSSWLVFTDGVPHAALSGRFALEHTYIVPRQALVAPDVAPISVLEKLCGQELSA